ncbi:MAG: A/G-specific DNA-adenine glycosylase [Polaromonas sp.]|nr:A/G-specific DNA-adenine glycosylase [Polaromonas sp.]
MMRSASDAGGLLPAANTSQAAVPSSFANEVVRWQQSHGRNSLPWQNTRDPYRVWLSEIMLQQTQVATVLAYYDRFLQRFPAVGELAAASEDEVMSLWSGLGYYSRARNLHRCAQDVMALHHGQFPASAEQLQTLQGIGRSTAAAIASFCFGQRVAILDGNVKRVLTRVLGFSGDLAQAAQERALWSLATELLPHDDLAQTMPRYTQGLMDLGATICTGRQPKCLLCPVQALCRGRAQGSPEQYPVKTRKLKRSAQSISLLWAQRPDGSVWLEKRPATGIWSGLYCLPVFDSDDAFRSLLPEHLAGRVEALPAFVHVLTHKDLHLSPWIAGFQADQPMPEAMLSESRPAAWFSPEAWPALGLPAPIRKLLAQDAAHPSAGRDGF